MRVPYLCNVVGKRRRIAHRVRGHGQRHRQYCSIFMHYAIVIDPQGHGMRPRSVAARVERLV